MRNVLGCAAIGLVLGMSSAFLGIGGGPINLVVLFHFFSMPTKRAAQSSLYIILFSQATSTVASLATGGAAGVDKLFIGLMVVIMGICVFNMIKYMGV